LIHFDLDNRYQDELVVGSAISRREGVLLSVIVHLLLIVALLVLPSLPMFQLSPEEIAEREAALQRQRDLEQLERDRRFVFVQPRVDLEALRPPERAELSDLDRRAQAPRRSEPANNPLPPSIGNSTERAEAAPEERARGAETAVPPDTEPPRPAPEEDLAQVLPEADRGVRRAPEVSRPAPGSLGDALRNLQQYVQNETFHNPQGGVTDPGATIQFDTKGIEFGPWIRRFVARVKRNWFIPQAAMTFRGRVVIQFNIHKDGRITDVIVAGPSSIDAFNRSAFNAILGSNPVEPLPPEYPEPVAAFTVTFFYNEEPPAP
jgi:TonB family protein